MADAESASVRLDKWLWAARFFKTRQIAIDAINAGRVLVNDERAKPAKNVRVTDHIVIRRPPYETHVVVRALSEKRVAAAIAQSFYAETETGIAARIALSAELKQMPPPIFKGRPTKRDRRTLESWQRAHALDGGEQDESDD